MADENYRELEQEQDATGIVDAGDFEDNAGTGMIAEDQETAEAAAQPEPPQGEPLGERAAEQNIPPMAPIPEEDVRPDLHEETPSGLDAAVIIVLLLIIIAGISYSIWNVRNAPAPQTVAQEQAVQQQQKVSDEPPFEVAELSEGVAVVVNGKEVTEFEVEEYIADFRELYDLGEEDAWAQWLVSSGYTPETLRNSVISMFVDDALVEQAVAELDVQVTPEEVDEVYDATRANFETEEEWQQALQEAGMTEEAFREQCERQVKQNALMELLADSAYPAEQIDAEALDYLKTYYPEYADATSLDGIDAEVVNPIREMLKMYAQQQAYTDYLDSTIESSDIKMSATPKDLPYNVNLLPYYFQNMFAQAQATQQQ